MVKPGEALRIGEFDPAYIESGLQKAQGIRRMKKNRNEIASLQDKFFADGRYSMLIVFQALDAAGKDSTVKHVFRKVRPQGIGIVNFVPPSRDEKRHDFLWRVHKLAPGKGMIQIFNRSHYEEVTTTRVHPEYVADQGIPGIASPEDITGEFWHQRFRQINDFERMLAENGTILVKFFLNVSEAKQSKRFLKRLRRKDKHWKFSERDIEEQKFRGSYLDAYEKAITMTSTGYAPWHIIPADRKWFMRYLVSRIILERMQSLDLVYPDLSLSEGMQPDEIRQRLSG